MTLYFMVKYMKNKKIIVTATIIVSVICAVFLIIISVMNMHSTNLLFESDTPWASEDIDIYIEDCSGTIKFKDKTINIFCGTLYNSIDFIDTDKEKISSTGESIIFSGECSRNISGDKLSVKITESNIDEVKVGDKIILYKLKD